MSSQKFETVRLTVRELCTESHLISLSLTTRIYTTHVQQHDMMMNDDVEYFLVFFLSPSSCCASLRHRHTHRLSCKVKSCKSLLDHFLHLLFSILCSIDYSTESELTVIVFFER